MLYCENCHSFHDEEHLMRFTECVGEYQGTPAYQTFYACPDCGSTDMEEAHDCPICGTPLQGSEDYCSGCIELADCALTEALKQIQNGLHIDYKDALELLTEQVERRN